MNNNVVQSSSHINSSGWTEAYHEDCLQQGKMLYNKCEDHIFLENIGRRTYNVPGVGTEIMRHIVSESFRAGFGGRVTTEACYSSHLFHLYMGMMPDPRGRISYLSLSHGVTGKVAVEAFPTIKDKIKNQECLSEKEKNHLERLKEIFADENQRDESKISDEEILKQDAFFKDLEEKTASYLTDDFIPLLLSKLEFEIAKPQPDTSSLFGIPMILSDDGIARWKKAIDNKEHFVPFKKLEHLRRYMTDKQKEELDKIMEQREQILKQK